MPKRLNVNDRKKKLLSKFNKRTAGTDFWSKTPLTGKADIISEPIPKKFLELRITSGSTGEPLYVFYSKEAVQSFVNRTCTSLIKSGVTKNDIILNLFAYGNYIPGSMYEKACQKIGLPVLPLGAPNTYPKEKVIEGVIKVKPTVWLSVPSYALGLLGVLENLNPDYKPRMVIVAGEKLLDSYIQRFNELEVLVSNHYGLTECPAIGISKGENLNHIEIINESIYIEAIKKEDGTHLVVTDLSNYSTPIIRYDTKDIIKEVSLDKGGSAKEFTLIGRNDDLVKLQGILIAKSKIVDILSKFTDNFFVNIKTHNNRDLIEILLENNLKGKENDINQALSFVLCKKEMLYSDKVEVPKTISNKTKYISDLRK